MDLLAIALGLWLGFLFAEEADRRKLLKLYEWGRQHLQKCRKVQYPRVYIEGVKKHAKQDNLLKY